MNFLRFYLVIVTVLMLLFSFSSSFAADTAPSAGILKIAEIMHRLKHFPSPAGKATLQQLSKKASTSVNEKVLIQAMVNLQHHATSTDIKLLKSLLNNKNANEYERSIANILLNLDHRPTKQDKVVLKKILGKR